MALDKHHDPHLDDNDADAPDDADVPEDWGLHIVRTANGFIAEGIGEPASVFVFEDKEDGPLDIDPDAMARLLNHVILYFDAIGGRYDAKRVRVIVEPGDKYEDAKAN